MRYSNNYVLILLPFLLIFSSFSLCANEEENLMKQANDAYISKKYEEAATLYKQIADNGNEGAILYYNLGNAYFKSGSLAESILWYERALRLDPGNEDIQHNIAFVNQKLVDRIEVLPTFFLTRWWNHLSQNLTSRGWAIASIIGTIMLIFFMISFLISGKNWIRSSSLILSFAAFLFISFTIIFAVREKNRIRLTPEAIIMERVIHAKSTPDDSSNDLFVIHEGLKVQITDQLNNWVEIKLPNGEKGWIPKASIEII